MANYTPYQVFEHVPLGKTAADFVVFTGKFTPPFGSASDIPIELQILEPAAAAGAWTDFTTIDFGGDVEGGLVRISVPAWATNLCGTRVKYQIRGRPLFFTFTDFEVLETIVRPRSDDTGRTWVRKTDGDMHVMPPDHQPVKRWYPATLDELLWCVQQHFRDAGAVSESHATASHWAMSQASVTHGEMIETSTPVHEYGSDQSAGRLNKVLYDVIPNCLSQEASEFFRRRQMVPVFDPNSTVNESQLYLFHVEAGMRIYELYSYADSDADGKDKRSLAAVIESENHASSSTPPGAPCYLGPWALPTMGGAGGQTIVGVASTATHGGDVNAGAISDLIVAMHLIAPDGQEYWIERTEVQPGTPLKLIDEVPLASVYRPGDPNSPGGSQRRRSIIYKRDDDLMNAALVSCGRMGVIYSVIVRTIRQYGLRQDTSEEKWDDVKKWIVDATHPKHTAVFGHRFVRIDVDLYPLPDFNWGDAALTFAGLALAGPVGMVAAAIFALKGDEYRAWLLTRQLATLKQTEKTVDGTTQYYGRPERSGVNAGQNIPMEVDPDKGCFTAPCRSANFIRQFLTDTIGHLSDIRDDAAEAWLAAGAAMLAFPPNAVWALPAQAIATGVIAFTEYWIIIFSGIRLILPDTASFGEFSCAVMNHLGSIHACSLLQLVYKLAQESQHLDTSHNLTAISYGVMDEHDYQNKGCIAPGDSIELFFDADKMDFVNFADYVIDQTRDLLDDGEVWAGYLSLRFMTNTPAMLGMQRWKRTVSMEIASLSRASGADELMKRIEEESRMRGVILHWGQRNNRAQTEIEMAYGSSMTKWRSALSGLSEHGRLADFSTEYTRLKGLEITVPLLYGLSASLSDGCAEESTLVTYDALQNPPETTLKLVQVFDNGVAISTDLPDLRGSLSIPLGPGRSTLHLSAMRILNGNKYIATPKQFSLHGYSTGDIWEFRFEAEQRLIAGTMRWYTEINLFSSFISNLLRVSEVELDVSAFPGWVMRNPEAGVVSFAGLSDTKTLASQPVFNTNWQFHSVAPAAGALPPSVSIKFKLVC